jgi:hypothetical protein
VAERQRDLTAAASAASAPRGRSACSSRCSTRRSS